MQGSSMQSGHAGPGACNRPKECMHGCERIYLLEVADGTEPENAWKWVESVVANGPSRPLTSRDVSTGPLPAWRAHSGSPLAAELKVSRIPLHLALERLAHEGFLEIRPTRGFVVQRFSTEDIYDAIELRGLLEGAAARLAAERFKHPSELSALQATSYEILTLVRRTKKLTMETFNLYIELNARFHSGLLDLSHSRMLRRAIQQACSLPFASPSAFLKRQYVSSDLWELFLISADQHCGIVDAILNRDAMRAEILTREHARVARRNLEDALRNSELPPDMAGAKLIELSSSGRPSRAR
jgi:GntR family transcriptional regulator of vanillate catabolism